jgi:hypothetical protein
MSNNHIMVLRDGTFTDLQGCFILEVPYGVPDDEIESFLETEAAAKQIRVTFGEYLGVPYKEGFLENAQNL